MVLARYDLACLLFVAQCLMGCAIYHPYGFFRREVDEIRLGMKRTEVQSIIATRPAEAIDYEFAGLHMPWVRPVRPIVGDRRKPAREEIGGIECYWKTFGLLGIFEQLFIYYDNSGNVIYAEFYHTPP